MTTRIYIKIGFKNDVVFVVCDAQYSKQTWAVGVVLGIAKRGRIYTRTSSNGKRKKKRVFLPNTLNLNLTRVLTHTLHFLL